jgi:hypothetical protein
MPTATQPALSTRRATPEDAAVCGPICCDAFAYISGQRNFSCDIPSAAVAQHTAETQCPPELLPKTAKGFASSTIGAAISVITPMT